MQKIVITEFMDSEAVEGLKGEFEVIFDPTLVDRPEELISLLKDAQGIIVRNRTQVRGELLEAAGELKAVGRLGVGLDNIDLKACKSRGIEVLPASGANDLAVAEYVITAIFMMFRKAYQSFEQMADGSWPRTELMGNETSGKVLGLIGFGSIARQTAEMALALGLKVIASDPYLKSDDTAWGKVQPVSLDEMYESADVISLHVPLTSETGHLIDEKAISSMKKGAMLINASRGGVVDDSALIAALKSGQLGGATLDVYENEPLSASFGEQMKGLKNLILTPHIGGVTIESNVRVSAVTADNVRKVLEA
jgi:(S)-sulfolactate dehydrogenase